MESMAEIETIEIPSRFCGPARSGNGGYVCGRMAIRLDGQVTVRLFAPPPLDRPLQLEVEPRRVRLLDGDVRIAEGRPSELELDAPAAPDPAAVRAASERFIGFQEHDFPQCFVCGTGRPVGDGLRIFAGSTEREGEVAAPWRVDPSLASDGRVGDEFVWAALDCPSAFAMLPVEDGRTLVLGEFTAEVERSVVAGGEYTVVGWRIGSEGRKRFAGSAVYDAEGRALARARSTWIDVPREAFPE